MFQSHDGMSRFWPTFLFFFKFSVFSTAGGIPAEPLFQLPVVSTQEINVGLDEFQRLQQGALPAADVDVAEKRLNGFQIQRVVEVRNGRNDQPAYRERRPTERRLDHVPARLQLSPDKQRTHRIPRYRFHHRPDVLDSDGVPLHGEIQIPDNNNFKNC